MKSAGKNGEPNTYAKKEFRNQQTALQMLVDFEEEIAHLQVDRIIERALDFITLHLGIDRVSLALLETEKGGFNLIAVRHDLNTSQWGHFIPFKSTIMTEVVKQRQAVYRPDIREEKIKYDIDRKITDAGFSSDLCVPLVSEDQCVGTMNAASTKVDGISEKERMVLTLLAPRLAQALRNAQLFEEVEHLKEHLELENKYLRKELIEVQAFGSIIGQSAALRNVLKQIEVVSPTDANVLITGESGTGKELIAREIHKNSLRRDHPMIRVNCATIPRELFESEFFGHIKGSFTGAMRDREGRFQAADRGTLFLDEVGEIPYELQNKLLRVLQEGEYERVGEEKTRKVDVRIIAATNQDLKQAILEKRFREDLYYRLNVFPIEIAPLRRRKEDIQPLAAHLLNTAKRRFNREGLRLTRANLLQLQNYDWPGNVREMQNIIDRAVITSQKNVLRFDLPTSRGVSSSVQGVRGSESEIAERVLTEDEMRSREMENISTALRQCKWKIYGPGGAAELLELPPTTLMGRIKKMGLKKPAG